MYLNKRFSSNKSGSKTITNLNYAKFKGYMLCLQATEHEASKCSMFFEKKKRIFSKLKHTSVQLSPFRIVEEQGSGRL